MAAPLLAVPNLSEGRDPTRIVALEKAFSYGASLLDRHSDPDHNRTVLTLAGEPGSLREPLLRGAEVAIGALDVCPLVWLDAAARDAARDEALAVAAGIGALGVPVFLYGALASSPQRA
ncbi:MAG TPA: hypothetical protein VF770_02070, partial [Solirubrobacterales bacterium]